ncbi:MAG: diaminopropionate ammonia-lyase [Rhodospirillales bacterium]|nr:diaminopropionate ammonia-lyase [Rhodospirillales bacterium]
MTVPFHLHVNPRYEPAAGDIGGAEQVILPERRAAARAAITGFEGYRPTPLHRLDALAATRGIETLWLKDESGRFGLGSFKALGGAYAVVHLLRERLGDDVSIADMAAGRAASRVSDVTVCCATDGNHGLAVAWGASRAGARCTVFLPGPVSEGRERAIAAEGADIVRIAGSYDEAVETCADEARARGWLLVSDTSHAGGDEAPSRVMHGYAMLVDEIRDALASTVPTHLFVQAGVGGLAAAVIGAFRQDLGSDSPKGVVVEPTSADCLYQSAVNGRPSPASGDLDTVMACLAAAEVSPLAWQVLARGAFAFMALDDDGATDAMRFAAAPVGGDPPLVLGESGAASLGGLIAVAGDAEAREALGLTEASRVLVIGSEGATDPDIYRRIVGRDPAAVAAG